MNRRAFLWLGRALGATMAAAVTVPAVLFVGARRMVSRDEAAIDVGAAEKFPDGQPIRVSLISPLQKDAYVVRRNVAAGAAWVLRRGAEVQAFSTVCPHAGCAVDLDGAAFRCPCHESRFGLDGARKSGPSPRGLDALPVTLVAGRVKIRPRR